MSENPLVQPEGVNAGSADESETRDIRDDASSPRAGGDPAAAPDSALDADQDDGDELAGATDRSEGGQDEGSID